MTNEPRAEKAETESSPVNAALVGLLRELQAENEKLRAALDADSSRREGQQGPCEASGDLQHSGGGEV